MLYSNSTPTKITQILSILCLQSNVEGVSNFLVSDSIEKIGNINHRSNYTNMI
jgi:hypothetical protein